MSLSHRLVLLSALVLVACDDHDRARTPTAPGPRPEPVQNLAGNRANYVGEAAVVSSLGEKACGWGTVAGESRSGVLWLVTRSGSSITLEEDVTNWPTDHLPFSGTLNGLDFFATYRSNDDYANYVCAFREASLSGTFSEDFDTFEAHEILKWGRPEDETTVERRWRVTRL